MTDKLARRGLRVHSQMEVDPLRTVAVRDVMSPVTEDIALDADTELATIAPDDLVYVALERMLDTGLELLPVVEDGHIVGVCQPNDIINARAHRLDHERVQPGWLTKALKRAR